MAVPRTEWKMKQAHQEFEFIARGEFRGAIHAQRKFDGNFDVARAVAQKFAQKPGLKRIAARGVRPKSTSRNQLRANAAESGSAILNMRNPPKPPNQPRPSKTYQFALPRKPGNFRCPPRSASRSPDRILPRSSESSPAIAPDRAESPRPSAKSNQDREVSMACEMPCLYAAPSPCLFLVRRCSRGYNPIAVRT